LEALEQDLEEQDLGEQDLGERLLQLGNQQQLQELKESNKFKRLEWEILMFLVEPNLKTILL
jgi:hypothetical protein